MHGRRAGSGTAVRLALGPWERASHQRCLALGVNPSELQRYTWIVRTLALGCPWSDVTTIRAGWRVALAALETGRPIVPVTDAAVAVWVARLCTGVDVAALGGPGFPLQLVTAARTLWQLPADLVVPAPTVVRAQPHARREMSPPQKRPSVRF